MTTDYSEKRDYYRMNVQCELQFRPHSSSEYLYGNCLNLSTGGIAFSADEFIATGSEVEIWITPEEAVVPPLHATVEVLRSTEINQQHFIAGKITQML